MEKGDFVKITFVGRIKGTGELFDTTDEDIAKKENAHNPQVRYGPIPVVVGEGQVLKGLDEELLKMKVGEKRSVNISPEKGFGTRSPKMIKTISAAQLKSQNINPVPGMVLNISNALGRIISVSSGRVRIDFNHPLAGKDLVYEIEVKERVESDKDKAQCIVERYTGSTGKIAISKDEAVVSGEVPKDLKESLSKDLMKHISTIKRVKFEEVFEAKKEETKK